MTAFIENLAVALYTAPREPGAYPPSAEGVVSSAIFLAVALCERLGHDITARVNLRGVVSQKCKRCGQTLNPDPEKR